MKKLSFWIAALCALSGSAFAQNVTGTWQGALKIKGPQGEVNLRTVFKISRAGDESLKATFYSIDQNPTPINASAVTLKGSALKISIAPLNGAYEGTLSSDSNSITGTWSQGGPTIPLNLARATAETAWTIPDPPPPPKTIPLDAKPTFEVSTIKPSKPEERFSLLVNRSGMMNTTDTSLVDLIKFAYGLHPRQITGGPSWAEQDKYDVTGKPDMEGIPSGPQLRDMVKKLLAERFELAFHFEKKELSVYAISVAKAGVKMTKDDNNPNGLPGFGGGPQGLMVRNTTMREFADMLQANILELPVVDQTDLGKARYDFQLKFTRDPQQGQLGAPPPNTPAPGDPDAPPDIFTAFQQQLGLKLESTKAMVDVMVIDKVEKPSAN